MEQLTILGKSTYAVGIILEIIQQNFHPLPKITLVTNIPDQNNESASKQYLIPGIDLIEREADNWNPAQNEKYVIGSIGRGRKAIFEYFKARFAVYKSDFIEVIHSSSVIGTGVQYGHGFHLSPLSVIAPFTNIGDFVVINRQCNIGHHVKIGDFVGINPGVTLSGLCKIGNNTIIGAGATILDQITIGKNVKIGAGSVVTKDIPDNVVAYGVPARIVREL